MAGPKTTRSATAQGRMKGGPSFSWLAQIKFLENVRRNWNLNERNCQNEFSFLHPGGHERRSKELWTVRLKILLIDYYLLILIINFN